MFSEPETDRCLQTVLHENNLPEGQLSDIYKEGKMHTVMIPAILPRSISRIDVTPFLPENSFARMFFAGTKVKHRKQSKCPPAQ